MMESLGNKVITFNMELFMVTSVKCHIDANHLRIILHKTLKGLGNTVTKIDAY